MRNHSSTIFALTILLVACLIAAGGVKVYLTANKQINEDEFMHLYWGWAMVDGQMPYKDFMMIHTPLPQFVIAPFFSFFHDDVNIIFCARILFQIFSFLGLFICFLIASKLFGKEEGFLSIILTLFVAVYLIKSVEVRPDQLAALFGISALFFLSRKEPVYFNAGLLCGLATITNQKFIFISFFLFFGAFIFTDETFKNRTINGCKYIAGGAVPVGIFLIWLFFTDAIGPFFMENYHVYLYGGNAASKGGATLNQMRHPFIAELLWQNPTYFIAVIMGMFFSAKSGKEKHGRWNTRFLWLYIVGLLSLYLLTFSHERQNSLYLIPLLSIFAGHGVMVGVKKYGAALSVKAKTILVIIVALIVIAPSAFSIRHFIDKTNGEQIRTWKYILQTVPTDKAVMDGHAGMFVYRKNALVYNPVAFNDARDIFYSMFDSKEEAAGFVIDALIINEVVLVIMEDVFEELLPEKAVQYIKGNYTLVTGYYQPLYIRK